jgi:hypothetical protein
MFWFWKKKTDSKPTITKEEVMVLLKPWGVSSIELSDRTWSLISDTQFNRIAYESGVRDKMYVPEKYDCDNFAHSFLAAFNTGEGWLGGICQGRLKDMKGAHRWVFYINDKKQLRFVEPQTYKRIEDVVSIFWFYTI